MASRVGGEFPILGPDHEQRRHERQSSSSSIPRSLSYTSLRIRTYPCSWHGRCGTGSMPLCTASCCSWSTRSWHSPSAVHLTPCTRRGTRRPGLSPGSEDSTRALFRPPQGFARNVPRTGNKESSEPGTQSWGDITLAGASAGSRPAHCMLNGSTSRVNSTPEADARSARPPASAVQFARARRLQLKWKR